MFYTNPPDTRTVNVSFIYLQLHVSENNLRTNILDFCYAMENSRRDEQNTSLLEILMPALLKDSLSLRRITLIPDINYFTPDLYWTFPLNLTKYGISQISDSGPKLFEIHAEDLL